MRDFTAGASDPVVAQAKFTLTENPALIQALLSAQSPQEANHLEGGTVVGPKVGRHEGHGEPEPL
ncbi:hypothetical protein MKK65_06130 [Methylobacterium sp. J-001]|uniref:hypothetical protein n=1 Tax=Methylobacterium sp. J-001 TaxID=2836609 RepID=UPI001FB8A8E6|nr:hypothetical protein [Methylobacterium sp. J-001]MCJ2116169.1 hypothetical protein [Methylobacterium sp. J-001]